jgi:hypothetical protein
LAEFFQRFEQSLGGCGVEAFERLVQNPERRVLEQHHGEGGAAGLSAGELHPVLPHPHIETLGQAAHKIGEAGLCEGLPQSVVTRMGRCQEEIVAQSASEQRGALAEIA